MGAAKGQLGAVLRLLLSARERLIKIRMDIEAQTRGILKTFGSGG